MVLTSRSICAVKTAGILLNLVHVIVYAFDGNGVLLLRWAGDVTNLVSTSLLLLMVILLARGWSIRTRVVRSPRGVFAVWGGLTLLHLVFFVWNSVSFSTLKL